MKKKMERKIVQKVVERGGRQSTASLHLLPLSPFFHTSLPSSAASSVAASSFSECY